MKKILMIMAVGMMSGCSYMLYPNWDHVRIEQQVPSKNCVYKMQEACSLRTNECLNWHKKRATKFDADTVVITQAEKLQSTNIGFWSSSRGENSSTLADYYYCNGPKNLK